MDQKNNTGHDQSFHTNASCPPLEFELSYKSPTLCYASITIPSTLIASIYHETAKSQQKTACTHGFSRGNVPLDYIKSNFKETLTEHLKEFLLKYCVINFLYHEMRTRKLLVSGDPRLINITLDPSSEAHFDFELTLFPEPPINDWKYFIFKAPKRKNYKDIDRQVDSFFDEEKKKCELYNDTSLAPGDWINFDVAIADDTHACPLEPYSQSFWFKMGSEDIESPLREIFLDKKNGDTFFTTNQGMQNYFSDQLSTEYTFRVAITDTIPYAYICFEQVKRHFKIKTNKDMHRKIIEVFSYRNDISQRRATVQEALRVMLSKHRFTIPNNLVQRQTEVLLHEIMDNPDYNVYRTQKDFQSHMHQLAERQMREHILIDRVAYHEGLVCHNEDVKNYLSLLNRPRMKEFIYFQLPAFKVQGQEVPIPLEEIKRTCLREKTINHIIHHLMKK